MPESQPPSPPQSSSAPVVIGKVAEVKGDAWIIRDGKKIPAQAEAALIKGDSVETTQGSEVSLVFADRSTFALKDKGLVGLDDFVFDPDTKTGHETLLVARGAFSFVSGDIAKSQPDAAHLATPVMSMGIRGTAVTGAVGDGGTTSVALVPDPGSNFVGEISVSPLGGGDAFVINTAGSGIVGATSGGSWSVSASAAASVSSFVPAPVAPPASAPALPAAPAAGTGSTGSTGTGIGTGTGTTVTADPVPLPPPNPGTGTGAGTGTGNGTGGTGGDGGSGGTKGGGGTVGTGGNGGGGTTSTNHDPTTSAVTLGSVTAGNSITITADQLRTNARDQDGDTLTITGVSTPDHGTITANADGSYTYTAAAGYSGQVVFTYTISDGRGGTVQGEAGLTATAAASTSADTNTAPVITAGDANGHGVISGAIATSDANGDTVTLTLVGATGGTLVLTNGTVVMDAQGNYTFTPNTGWQGGSTASFTVEASDGHGGVTSRTIVLTETNTAPTASAVTGITWTPNTPGSFPDTTLVMNATDPDGDSLSASGFTAQHGTVSYSGGNLYYTPDTNYAGPDVITYTISDGRGGTVTGEIDLTIAASGKFFQNGGTLFVDTAQTLADTDFTGVTGAGTLMLRAVSGTQSVTLDSEAQTAGITTVDASATTGAVTVNQGLGNSSGIVVYAGSGVDTFVSGSASDHVIVNGVDYATGYGRTLISMPSGTTGLNANAGAAGGILVLNDAGTVTDAAFTDVYNFQTLFLHNGDEVTLAHYAQYNAGITTVDASATTGAVTVNVSGYANSGGIVFVAGSGINTFIESGGTNHVMVGSQDWVVSGAGEVTFVTSAAALNAAPTLAGNNSFGNHIILSDNGTVVDADFANVTYVASLGVHDGGTVSLGTHSDAAGISSIDARHITTSVTVHADDSSAAIQFLAGGGAEVFTGGTGASNIVYTSASELADDTLTGGSNSNNAITIGEANQTIADAAFTHVTNVHLLNLASGDSVTLDAHSQAAGITTISGNDITVDASARTDALAFQSSGGTNIVTGGSGSDNFIGGTGDDTFTGGLGADHMTGGGGHNLYVYTDPTQSQNGASVRDVIADFTSGTDHIQIALSGTHVDVSSFASVSNYNAGQATLAGGGVVGDGFYASYDQAFYIYVNGNSTDIGTDGGYVIGSANAIAATDLIFNITGTSGADTLVGGAGTTTMSGGLGADTLVSGSGTTVMYGEASSGADNASDTFVLSNSGSTEVKDYGSNDVLELDNSKFSLGSSGTLATSQYSEVTSGSMTGTAQDLGNGNTGAGIIAIDSGGSTQLWYSSTVETASTSNSHLVATLNGVNTSTLDNTSFHLAV